MSECVCVRVCVRKLHLNYCNIEIRYKFQRHVLPQNLEETFFQSELDEETLNWLNEKKKRFFWSDFYVHHAMTLLLKFQYSKTDCGGLLNRDMYVFSKAQFRNIIPKNFIPKKMLDIGAGDSFFIIFFQTLFHV